MGQPIEQLPAREQAQVVRPLLDHLAGAERPVGGQWQEWQITPVDGGWCNLLYRATGPLGDLAVKFTIRDGRQRADREHGALLALHQAGLPVAPTPVLLDRRTYAQPVVVQTWLAGHVSVNPPSTDAEWGKLVEHMALIHSVTPGRTRVRLRKAVLNAAQPGEGRAIVRQQVGHLPREAQPAALRDLVRRLEAARFPEWPEAPVALCRVDTNILNVLRRPGRWASVDWENSGWGDPAFDLAGLITHASYIGVPAWRWERVIDAYCDLVEDPGAAVRIRVYWRILLVWWLARLCRYLYEIPRGLDPRLATWPEDWQADLQAKYEHYLGLAQAAYS